MEAVALVYGFPPSELDRLDLDELAMWAGWAEHRLTEHRKK